MSFLETYWATVPLGRVVKLNARTLPETTDPDFEFRYVDISSVGRGELVEKPQTLTFKNSPSRARRVLRPGDTLVSTVRTYLRAVMRVSDDETDLVGSTGFAVLTAGPQLDSRFLSWFSQSDPFIEEVVARSVGVNYPAISPPELARLPVPMPNLTVQRAIADFLDAETARIDALIAKKHHMIELLEKRWRSAVEHRMVELAVRHGSVMLKRLVQSLDGQRIPLSAEERAERQGLYPYYGASGVIDQVDGYLFDEELVLLGEDGAQLADSDYEISFVVREKCWVNNHAHVLRPIGADADFLALHLSTFDRFAFISGSTREKITQEDMWKIMVPAVDLGMQRSEARQLLDLKQRARDLGYTLGRQINLLAEHRQALITAAVTGRIEVPGAAMS